MIITFMGTPSAGKSYLAHRVAKHYNLPHYSIGDLRRQAAAEKGLTLAEYNELGETEDTDTQFDEYQKNLPKKIPDFVIDGRLSAFFLPQAIKVFVDAREEVRAERMQMNDPEHKRIGELAKSKQEAIDLMQKRVASDTKRYKQHYNTNPYEKSSYDIILDTSDMNKEESFQALLKQIEAKRKI